MSIGNRQSAKTSWMEHLMPIGTPPQLPKDTASTTAVYTLAATLNVPPCRKYLPRPPYGGTEPSHSNPAHHIPTTTTSDTAAALPSSYSTSIHPTDLYHGSYSPNHYQPFSTLCFDSRTIGMNIVDGDGSNCE